MREICIDIKAFTRSNGTEVSGHKRCYTVEELTDEQEADVDALLGELDFSEQLEASEDDSNDNEQAQENEAEDLVDAGEFDAAEDINESIENQTGEPEAELDSGEPIEDSEIIDSEAAQGEITTTETVKQKFGFDENTPTGAVELDFASGDRILERVSNGSIIAYDSDGWNLYNSDGELLAEDVSMEDVILGVTNNPELWVRRAAEGDNEIALTSRNEEVQSEDVVEDISTRERLGFDEFSEILEVQQFYSENDLGLVDDQGNRFVYNEARRLFIVTRPDGSSGRVSIISLIENTNNLKQVSLTESEIAERENDRRLNREEEEARQTESARIAEQERLNNLPIKERLGFDADTPVGEIYSQYEGEYYLENSSSNISTIPIGGGLWATVNDTGEIEELKRNTQKVKFTNLNFETFDKRIQRRPIGDEQRAIISQATERNDILSEQTERLGFNEESSPGEVDQYFTENDFALEYKSSGDRLTFNPITKEWTITEKDGTALESTLESDGIIEGIEDDVSKSPLTKKEKKIKDAAIKKADKEQQSRLKAQTKRIGFSEETEPEEIAELFGDDKSALIDDAGDYLVFNNDNQSWDYYHRFGSRIESVEESRLNEFLFEEDSTFKKKSVKKGEIEDVKLLSRAGFNSSTTQEELVNLAKNEGLVFTDSERNRIVYNSEIDKWQVFERGRLDSLFDEYDTDFLVEIALDDETFKKGTATRQERRLSNPPERVDFDIAKGVYGLSKVTYSESELRILEEAEAEFQEEYQSVVDFLENRGDSIEDYGVLENKNIREVLDMTGALIEGVEIEGVSFDVNPDRITVSVQASDFKMDRIIRDESVSNDLFVVNDDARDGLGLEVFANQVANLENEGGTYRIRVSAAGGPNDSTYNGYYTWARFGYEMQSAERLNEYLLGEESPFATDNNGFNVYTFDKLFETKAGRDWWKDKGTSFSGVFHLSRAQADDDIRNEFVQRTSTERLNEYLESRGFPTI